MERTLSIIKPDGTARNLIGQILARFEAGGLRIVEARMVRLTAAQAGEFYEIHRGKPFFEPLVQFMTSGPVLVSVLEGPDAVAKNRAIMGATDPKKAEPGTIRRDFSDSIDANTVHGSDSVENAQREIRFFFPAAA